MKDILFKNSRLKSIIAILFALLVFFSSIINFYIDYKTEKTLLYTYTDCKLKSAALNTALLLGDNFFDRAIEKDSILPEEDIKNIYKLSKLAKNSTVIYVYSMIEKNGDIFFTSSSATDKELRENSFTRYFDKYEEATDKLKNIFVNKQLFYEESTDRWGTFRSVLIPMQTLKGTPYIIYLSLLI